MKAIQMHAVGGPEVLRLGEIDVPQPGAGQVLVKVEAAGVTYGDVMKRQGGFGPDLPLPAGLGLVAAGSVAAVGAEVSAPALGSRVMAWVEHGYAEYALASASAVVPLPDTVDVREATALPVQGVTAYQTLHDAARLQPGESVLIHAAAGGVGNLAVQFARLHGASTVIGTASRPDKLGHIRGLGAVAVDYTDEKWPQHVLDATDGKGVDVVLDSVGGTIAAKSLECLAPFGRLVSFGAASGSPAAVTGMSLMFNNQSIIGYGLPGQMQKPARLAEVVGKLVQHLADGELDVTIGQALSLEQAEQAHRAIDQRDVVGATVLLP
ncbi:zinc-binding alcohol dehydrogenase family protein [Nonomuraea angiospora]|uniref:NADPH2:quinone reductase n=1 Tax=Nonomuraea angiospora TaxID=46172 RepID=A0ABR9LT04_9ACTN|nr:zinc-binding dehydrogenase [Nonomuraea angiospora]MBE1583791.1 NADPH2:quinone reductase [Nonomuraea angiospora]